MPPFNEDSNLELYIDTFDARNHIHLFFVLFCLLGALLGLSLI